jgi:hypothetical protein
MTEEEFAKWAAGFGHCSNAWKSVVLRGTIAADGDGADRPFAIALAHHLTDPGVEVLKLFRLVRDDVLAATHNGQEVFQDSSLPGTDFFFRPH